MAKKLKIEYKSVPCHVIGREMTASIEPIGRGAQTWALQESPKNINQLQNVKSSV